MAVVRCWACVPSTVMSVESRVIEGDKTTTVRSCPAGHKRTLVITVQEDGNKRAEHVDG